MQNMPPKPIHLIIVLCSEKMYLIRKFLVKPVVISLTPLKQFRNLGHLILTGFEVKN